MGGDEKQEEKKEMKVKINLGCGKDIKPGWINVDKIEYPSVDVVHDLNEFPWPFDDNFADYILMNHVLEHLDDVVKVMEEVWRILKPGGIVEIYTPYYKSKKAFRDPTHKHFFTEESMNYFTRNWKWRYTHATFRIIKFEKFRNGFPFWHVEKYLGIRIRIPWFADTLHWIMQAEK